MIALVLAYICIFAGGFVASDGFRDRGWTVVMTGVGLIAAGLALAVQS